MVPFLRRFLKLSIPLIAITLFLSAHVSSAGAVTCSPPTVITGCTEDLSGGVTLTATVPSSGVVAPTISTDSATGVSDTTATLGGILSVTGGANSTVEGFSYGETTSYDTTTLNSGSFGVGSFSASLTGLLCATTYHYQAYATNPAGTGRGADMTFTTADCPVIPDDIGNSGGGGGHGIPTTSTVNFSGTAYPGAHVVILRDGVVMTAATASADGNFLATVAGVESGSYVFSAYAQDVVGRLSASYSFPFYINGRSIVSVNGILIAPTIALNKTSVMAGGKVTVSGAAAPNSVVNIVVDSKTEKKYSALADASGSYSFAIDTTGFTDPTYAVSAHMLYGGKQSPFSKSLVFHILGTVVPDQPTDQLPPEKGFCGAGQGDLNCDGHVNIIDFSIMKFWYRKENPPVIVDLSGDGTITLKDFSILAADWTG